MSIRLRRLQAEYERLIALFADHQRIRIAEAIGDPPDKYVVEYYVQGLVEEKGEIKGQGVHRAQITLGPNYPRELPRCVMLTPIFHPNIDHLAICTEDIGAAGQTLDQTIVFIGEMIAYQTYNLQSPRNGDAARWASEHRDEFPLEGADLTPRALVEGSPETVSNSTPTTAQKRPVMTLEQDKNAVNHEAVDESLQRREPTQEQCTNCGQSSSRVKLELCNSHHLVCLDCLLACQNCRRKSCVLCDIRSCSSCQDHFCSDCTVECDGCRSVVCLAHIHHCQVCHQ